MGELSGRRLGAFLLEAEIGRGASGVVHRGRLADGRASAIKVVDPVASGMGIERARREARAAQALSGRPGLVEILAVEEVEGLVVIAMEHLPGGDLDGRIGRRGPLPEREAVALAIEVATALEHVHAAGLVHRDVKPSNVLFDERGAPRLTDLGLALDLDAPRLTEEGALIGTPEYMAPELARSRRHLVGPATDVYGLGATLYDALVGRPAFSSGSFVGLLAQIVRDPPPPVRAGRPGCSAATAEVVRRALEKAPADRFPTARALADALREALQGLGA